MSLVYVCLGVGLSGVGMSGVCLSGVCLLTFFAFFCGGTYVNTTCDNFFFVKDTKLLSMTLSVDMQFPLTKF